MPTVQTLARPPVRRRALTRAGVLVPLGYLVLAVGVTARWWSPLGGRVTAVNEPDAVLFGWLLTWTPRALADGRLPLYTDALNHPDGLNLLWNNGMVLPALLVAPVTLAFGGLAAVTVLTTLGLAGTAATAYGCLRALHVGAGPAAVGGLLAGFSPAMVAQAAGGHPNLVLNVLVPVLLLLAVRVLTAPGSSPSRRRDAVLLGAAAGAQVWVGEEVLFLAGLVVALFALVLGLSHPREAVRRAGAVARHALLALAVFAAVGGPALAFQLAGPLPQSGAVWDAAYYSTDLAGFVVGTPLQVLTTAAQAQRSAAFAGGLEEHTALLGVPLLLLVAAALVRYRRDARLRTVLLVAAATALLALGPQLVVDGGRTGVPLPWALLVGLPGFEHVIATRLPLFTTGLVAAGLALALDRVRTDPAAGSLARALVVGAVAGSLLPLVPGPLPSRDAPEVPAFFTSDDPALRCPGSVLVLPFPSTPYTDAMAWQQAGGITFAMPGGYFIGPDATGRAALGGQPTHTGRLLRGVADDGAVRAVTPQVAGRFRADLARWRTCAIVLAPGRNHAALRAQVTALVGAPPEDTGGVAVWRAVS